MNINGIKHPITFNKVERLENEADKVALFVKIKGISYKFVVVDKAVQSLSDQEIQIKYGAQFANLGKVARTVDLQIGETLLQKEQHLVLKGRDVEMETRTLDEMKITLPKNLPQQKLAKIDKLYRKIDPDKTEKKTVNVQKKHDLPKMDQDIVAEFSQGRLTDVRNAIGLTNKDDDNIGSLACTVICMKAVQHFFDRGLPKSVNAIYHLIDKGVQQYKRDKFDGLVHFDEVYNNLSPKKQSQIETVKLSEKDGVPAELGELEEFTGPVNTYLDPLLKALQSKVGDDKICGVFTTQTSSSTNATLVIMFDEDKKPVLFNSHGEEYKGELKGASLLKFNDMNELSAYIKKTFFKNEEEQFQLRILRKLVH